MESEHPYRNAFGEGKCTASNEVPEFKFFDYHIFMVRPSFGVGYALNGNACL